MLDDETCEQISKKFYVISLVKLDATVEKCENVDVYAYNACAWDFEIIRNKLEVDLSVYNEIYGTVVKTVNNTTYEDIANRIVDIVVLIVTDRNNLTAEEKKGIIKALDAVTSRLHIETLVAERMNNVVSGEIVLGE